MYMHDLSHISKGSVLWSGGLKAGAGGLAAPDNDASMHEIWAGIGARVESGNVVGS